MAACANGCLEIMDLLIAQPNLVVKAKNNLG